ncbi:MAG: flippase-like domain-containing protein, partial [Hadesarchaea archaeon]|nr:flippase-like domain-containing protein [Hadesarchaea archaeon]
MLSRNKEVKVNLKKALIPIIIVVIIIISSALLIFQENLSGMINSLQTANYLFVILAFAIYFCSAFFWASRWRIGLSALGEKARMKNLFPIIWGSMFINNMTPLNRTGGDPVGRPYLLKKVGGIKFRKG